MKDEKLLAAARATLEKYLRSKGMRQTPERLALLEKIFSSGDHFFTDVLYESMELEGYHVSRSTVYATLQLFLEAGLVKRHQFGDQPAQYERLVPGAVGNHIHLVCSVCGRVKEVRDPMLTETLCRRTYAGFRPSGCALYVYGTCGRCDRAAKRKQRSDSRKNQKF